METTTPSNLSTLISGQSSIGVNLTIDKESAIILGLVIIASILVGGLLLKMLSNALSLN